MAAHPPKTPPPPTLAFLPYEQAARISTATASISRTEMATHIHDKDDDMQTEAQLQERIAIILLRLSAFRLKLSENETV
jgi:hypothetical protein